MLSVELGGGWRSPWFFSLLRTRPPHPLQTKTFRLFPTLLMFVGVLGSAHWGGGASSTVASRSGLGEGGCGWAAFPSPLCPMNLGQRVADPTRARWGSDSFATFRCRFLSTLSRGRRGGSGRFVRLVGCSRQVRGGSSVACETTLSIPQHFFFFFLPISKTPTTNPDSDLFLCSLLVTRSPA